MLSIRISRGSLLAILLTMALTLSCCGGRSSEGCEVERSAPQDNNSSSFAEPHKAVISQDPDVIETVWEAGPHADTYVVSMDNTNSSCARCHSPMNWTPTSEEIPASWTARLIDTETGPLLISKMEWANVDCQICHNVEKGQIIGEIAWLEIAPQGIYSEVDTSTALCQKCHLAEGVEGHEAVMVESSHADFLCADCHDAHSTIASCSSAGCHEPFAEECESIETHDKPHSEVTCNACHDGGESKIDWNEELGKWDTFLSEGNAITDEFKPFTSHNVVLEVNCDRCHAPGDHPWDP